MQWRSSRGECGDWYWSVDLPNVWTAQVADHSQAVGTLRPKPTVYYIAAICRHWLRQGAETYTTLEEAKSAAIELAMLQTDECIGTEYHFEGKG